MAYRRIIWTKNATRDLENALKYIRKDSEQQADKIKQRLILKIAELSDAKVVHRKEPYKRNNDGSFLYFEVLKYRVVYQALPKAIVVVRIRHTNRNPKFY